MVRSSIARGTLLLTVANLLMRGVSMAFQVYLTDQVGAAGIGLLQLILTVHAFAITVGTSGIRVAAMYLTAEEYGLGRSGGIRQAVVWCMAAGTLLSGLVGAAMAAFAPQLAAWWVKDLRAAASLRLLGLTLPVTCLSSILAGYFTACNQVRRLVAVEVADRILTVFLTIWLLGLGVPGDLSHACVAMVGGGALASLGSVAVLLWMLLGDLRRRDPAGESLSMGKRLLRFCVPVALNDYLRSGLGTLEQFLIPYGLARFGGSRTQALADYGTIHGMVFPVLMLFSTVLYALSDLLVPELARYRAQKNQARIRHLTERCLRVGLQFSALVAGVLWVTAKPVGFLLYDSAQAGHYLRLFAPLVPILYLDCIVDGMHKGLGQQIYCVRVNTLTNLLDVIGLYLLLPRLGIAGYYLTYVCTHVLNFFLSIHRLLRFSGHVPVARTALRTLLCVTASALFTQYFVPLSNHWRTILTAAALFLTVSGLLLRLAGEMTSDN